MENSFKYLFIERYEPFVYRIFRFALTITSAFLMFISYNYGQCRYYAEEVITFNSVTQNSDPSYESVFVLANAQNQIVEVSAVNYFSSKGVGKYFIYGVNYKSNSTVANLNVGNFIQNISGDCFDLSIPTEIEVCASISNCDDFIVNAGPSHEICPGQSFLITGYSNRSDATFVWDTGQVGNSISVSPMVTTTYTVTARLSNGCIVSDAVTIVVTPIVQVDAGADHQICKGSEVELLATAGPTAVFIWNGYTFQNPLRVSPSVTTEYTVVSLDGGCSSTDVVMVFVDESEPASITADNTELCQGQNAILSIDNRDANIQWSTGQSGPDITVAPTITTTYAVTVTNQQCIITDAITIQVHDQPSFDILDLTLCSDEASSFNIRLQEPLNYQNGDWYLQGALINNPENIQLSESTTFSYRYVTAHGCLYIDDMTVQLLPSITMDIADQSICRSESFDFDLSSLEPLGFQNGFWYEGTQRIFNPRSTVISENSIYEYRYTSNGSCSSNSNVSFEIFENPTVILPADELICPGDSIDLLVTTSIEGSYSWSSGHTEKNIKVAPTVNTNYSLTLTDQNGCMNIQDNTSTVAILIDGQCDLCALYNCPALDDCDYCEGQAIILTSQGGNQSSDYITQYILVDQQGGIVSLYNTLDIDPQVVGTYFLFAINYQKGSNVSGLAVGASYLGISGECLDISDPFIFRVCESPIAEISVDLINDGNNANNMYQLHSMNEGIYLWSTGEVTRSILVDITQVKEYTLSLTNELGCLDQNSVNLEDLNNNIVGNKMFFDDNGNGLQDANDRYVVNAKVHLYSAMTDELIATTTTSTSGSYIFSDLSAGHYYLAFEMPLGYIPTLANEGSEGSRDSDIDESNGINTTETFPLHSGKMDLSIDAGIILNPSIVDLDIERDERTIQIPLMDDELELDVIYDQQNRQNFIYWNRIQSSANGYYELYRALGTEGAFVLIDTYHEDNNTHEYEYADEDLTESGLYYYKVYHYDSEGAINKTEDVSFYLQVADRAADIELFPNPTRGVLNIKNNLFEINEQEISVKVYTSLGEEVLDIDYSDNDPHITLDISHLMPGSYLLKVVDIKGQIWVEKFLVSN